MGSEGSIYEPSVPYMSEGNAGGRANKHPLPTLRVRGSNMGNVWMIYGGVEGGTENDDSFCVYFRGIVGEVFGCWKMTVKGKDLDPLCGQIAAHTQPTIMPGRNENSISPYSIETITFEQIEGIE